jgi:hypothetical protein
MEDNKEKVNHLANMKNIKLGMEETWEAVQNAKSVAIRGQHYEVSAALRDLERKYLLDK